MTQARKHRNLAISVTLAALFFASLAEAQSFGRIKFKVRTPEGENLQGVQIVVTCEAIGNYGKELKTNKKGEAILSVVDGTKMYSVRVDHEGYRPFEAEIKPALRQTIEREIVLVPPEASAPAAGGGDKAKLTPAQEAFNEGVKASQEEDFETAKAKFEEALKRDKKLWNAHSALAGLYFEDGDYETAISHANQLLELDPQNARGYRVLYEAHTRLGNKGEAKKALATLSNMDEASDAAAVVYNEGVAAFKVGDNKTAKANFLRALEVKPDLTAAIQALALIYLQDDNGTEAAAMAERLLAIEPGHPKMLRLRWEAYRKAGDAEKEKEAFEELAAADPTVLIKELFETGVKQFEAGDTANAKSNFENVLAIDDGHPRAHYRLALCLIGSGDSAAAKEHFEKFIELASPDDPELGTAKEMLGFLQ